MIALLLFLLTFNQADAAIISGRMDQYNLGAWAYKQHNSICALIYPAIANGQLKTIGFEGKTLGKADALRKMEQKATVFISTNSDDPTQGYDTSYYIPLNENFYAFAVTGQQVKVRTDKQAKELVFAAAEFNKLLSAEQSLYLNLYKNNSLVLLDGIPETSQLLMQDINLRLHLEGKLAGTKLYKTDSLTSVFSEYDKANRGSTEIVAFISTDPNDPTIGRDTTMYMPLAETMKGSDNYQCIYFILNGDASNLHLEALSAGFMVTLSDMQTGLNLYYGFMRYKTISNINPDEKALIESSLLCLIEGRLLPFNSDYDAYMEKFKLQEEAAHKKQR